MSEQEVDAEEEWNIVEDVTIVRAGLENSNSDPVTTEGADSEEYEETYDDNYDDNGDGQEGGDVQTSTNHDVIPPAALGLTFSYRDAVAMNKRPAPSKQTYTSTTSAKRQQTAWKPIFKIEKVIPTAPVSASSSLIPDPDDDDVGMSDLVNAHLNYKHSSATTRYRSVTMLTPGQQATKDTRIQAKLSK